MADGGIEKRKSERLIGFWKISNSQNDKQYCVKDVSNTGFKLWIEDQKVPDKFEIIVPKPWKEHLLVKFEITKKWEKRVEIEDKIYLEVGCEFEKLSQEQLEIIEKLKKYFFSHFFATY